MSGRLELIKSLILPAPVIADVGCDHGLIAEYCIKSVLGERVIASDIGEKCLDKAKARLSGIENVEFVCCDGISYDCDEAIIAGMGGLTIVDILISAKKLPETAIVSPHRDGESVRRTLLKLGYCIERDIPVLDRNRYYEVIRATLHGDGVRAPNDVRMLFGTEIDTPSAALKVHLRRLYNTYMLAPDKNAARLKLIKEAMCLQGMEQNPK